MKHFFLVPFMVVVLVGIASCKKNNSTTPTPPPPTPTPTVDTTGPLKAVAPLPIGFAVGYNLFANNASYRNVVTREASQVTFGYEMKHGAIVKNDGSFDYSTADALFNLVTAAGLKVYGHTLVWYQNQNGDYLRSLTMSSGTINSTNLLPQGDFEAGTGTS